jgi:dihydrofolate reductase
MGGIIVFTSLTLDGVMQAPGRPDEDTRGGFRYGGWGAPYADEVSGSLATQDMATTGAILLGRRTYEDFYAFWPKQNNNIFTDVLNNTPKYVASTTLKEPLPWVNSILLKGDVPEAVAGLKAQLEKDMVVLGSGELARTLIKHNLVDRYTLLIHPLLLGSGRHLFPDDGPYATLRLVDARPTTTGVIIATYEPAEQRAAASLSS